MILKKCPHCGGSASLVQSYSRNAHCYFVFVKCDICGAQGKAFTEDVPAEDSAACRGAIDAWNMRTGEANAE